MFPFLQGLEAREVQRYKSGAYCRTNWRCTAVLFPRPVGVGVSETLMKFAWKRKEESAKTSCPRLRLEVPDIPLPDIGDQPKFWSTTKHRLQNQRQSK